MQTPPLKLVNPWNIRNDRNLINPRSRHHLIKILHLPRLESDGPLPCLTGRRDLLDGRGETEQVTEVEVVGVALEVLFDDVSVREGGRVWRFRLATMHGRGR